MKQKRMGAILLALMMLVSLFSMPVRAESVLPQIELSGENTAVLICGDYTVRRVYYGYLGAESKPYTNWETFKENVGDTFTPDYAPKESSAYALEKAGYYQFVVNYLNGKRRTDLAFTVKVEADQTTAVAPTMEGGVLHFNQATVRKVYYGYVGSEKVDYTNWSTFKETVGETLTADFAPADGKEYLLTREGYYQFVVNYIWGNTVRDVVFTAKVEKNSVPVVSNATNNNLAVLQKGNESFTVKVYYAYLGEAAETPLKWADFRALESFTADYGVPDEKAYLLKKKGVYQFVVSYKNAAGVSHDLTYLVKAEAAAEEPAIQAADGGFVLHHNSAVRVNKIYVGYMGEELVEVSDWAQYQKEYVSNIGISSPKDGYRYALGDGGYYTVVIDYYDGLENRLLFETLLYSGTVVQEKSGTLIKMMTHNVKHAGATQYGDKGDGTGNNIYNRLRRFKSMVMEEDPDIIFNQEARVAQINFFTEDEYFNDTYECIWRSRGPDGVLGGEQAAPLLYKKEKYTLLDSGHFWLSDTPNVSSAYGDSTVGAISTWALLKDKATGERFYVYSTHFDFGTEASCGSMQQYMELFDKMSSNAYAFVGGVFNVQYRSADYEMMMDWNSIIDLRDMAVGMNADKICELGSMCNGRNLAMEATPQELPEADYRENYGQIDYIMAKKNSHMAVDYYGFNTKAYDYAEEGIAAGHISDHFALITHVRIGTKLDYSAYQYPFDYGEMPYYFEPTA